MTDNVRSRAEGQRPRRYRGGCQCGAVLWEVQLDPRTSAAAGDSVWQRSVPSPLFSLLRGNEGLSGYQFFANSAHHFFCTRCSAHVFSHELDQGPERYTIDLRSLHPDHAHGPHEQSPQRSPQRSASS